MDFQEGEPVVIFAGFSSRLEDAYPALLRQALAQTVEILPTEISSENWRESLPALARAEVIMATWGMPPLTAEFLAAAKSLRAVFYAAGSVKGFATSEAFDRGIVISSARDANAIPVAEFALATILLSLKRFWSYAQAMRSGHLWARDLPVPGAYRSTVGLVSLGATGRRTAALLSAFDLDVIAYNPLAEANDQVRLVSLEEVFREATVVSIHTPLLPQTRGLIDGRLIRSMKPGATLINTARGAIIVEKDLCDALLVRPDLTAVLDVLTEEPPAPSSPLFSLPNAVLTPHISGSMNGEVARMGEWMHEELQAFLAGRPLRHQVLPEMLASIA